MPVLVTLLALSQFLVHASPVQRPVTLGVEVSDRPSAFVDIVKAMRPFLKVDSDARCPTDSSGWPMSDGRAVLMDDRPTMAWAPPIDDPEKRQPDESGTYSISFEGQADVTAIGGSPAILSSLKYEPATNRTSGKLTLPAGQPNLIVLQFVNTRRKPVDALGSGITGLRVIRPGYAPNTKQIFTNDFLRALTPFAYLRFMGWADTNYQTGYYGDAGHHVFGWDQRTLPTDASQGMGIRAGDHGVAWEYMILLANALHKDVWINVPVTASGDRPGEPSYVRSLAELFKHGDAFTGGLGLDPKLHIYVEHSNEVWNFGFSQYIWNKLAAVDEVSRGSSPLNADGSKDQEQWARRRHAKRLYEIAKIFESVFGAGSLNTRIRPIYAAWTIQPDWYDEVLGWMDHTFGPPKNYFYALAETVYFNDQKASKTASVPEVLAAMRADADDGLRFTTRLRSTASKHGLRLAAYEAGPDNGGGNPTNIGNRIEANRAPEMRDLVEHVFRDDFFGQGGDLATYFALSSSFSRYGCWGATDDLARLDTPKYRAILNLVGRR